MNVLGRWSLLVTASVVLACQGELDAPPREASHVKVAVPLQPYAAGIYDYLLDVDSRDEAVVVGPSLSGGLVVRWFTSTGSMAREVTFPEAIVPRAFAIGADDSLWMAGDLTRTANFGGSDVRSIDVDDLYLTKLDPDGGHVLSQSLDNHEHVWLRAAATDSEANVYLVGSLIPEASSTWVEDLLVMKYSATGTLLYRRQFHGTEDTVGPEDVAIAPNGEVVVAGYYDGSLDFGVTTLTSLAFEGSLTTLNGFVAVLDPRDGSARWARNIGGTVFDTVRAVDVTAEGSLRVSGQLSGESAVGAFTVTADPKGSPFVAELDGEGATRWARVLDGEGSAFGSATDGLGRTFAVGRVADDDSTFPMNGAISFVAQVTSDGSVTFPLRLVTNGNGAQKAAVDSRAGLWVLGAFAGTVDFGTGPLATSATGNGGAYLLYLSGFDE